VRWAPDFHRKREWKTKTGKANFIEPKSLSTDVDLPPDQRADHAVEQRAIQHYHLQLR